MIRKVIMTTVSGTQPGQRQLNGPQTTGRDYRNLSEPQYRIRHDVNVGVPCATASTLLADVHRPDADGRFPRLIAASPYPRQIQDLGAPVGFIEAGATDFWVPRGYVHVIANLRGTGGSGGTFGFFDAQERRDMHDLVEWAAAQPWCDGNVGMIGISYFAMTQLEAAVERPPHLKAIFPVAVTTDLYEAALPPRPVQFVLRHAVPVDDRPDRRPQRRAVAQQAASTRSATCCTHAARAREVRHDERRGGDDDDARCCSSCRTTRIRGTICGVDVVVEHPARDEWWDERNLLPLLDHIDIPVYLGCDWENVPLHLPSTFTAWQALDQQPECADRACSASSA